MSAQDEGPDGAGGGPPATAVQVAVTAACLVIVAVHLIWPDLNIDAITLGLLVLAVSPWLGRIFTSIEAPGGWKLEYRQLQRKVDAELSRGREQVEALTTRVEQVEQFALSGSLTERQSIVLQRDLGRYREFLHACGYDEAAPLPRIHVGRPSAEQGGGVSYVSYNAYFDLGRNLIVMGTDIAEDIDVALREYTHHVVHELRPDLTWNEGSGPQGWSGVQSALADYLPCSFRDDPCFGRGSAATWNRLRGSDEPCLRNLDNHLAIADVEPPVQAQSVGLVWGGAFWQCRRLCGPREFDRILLDAFRGAPTDAFTSGFVGILVDALHNRCRQDRTEVERIFSSRGLAG